VYSFAHAETLVSLICAFGLHKDIQPLSPNEYKAHRNFSVGTIAPLAGNIQFVLYNCPTNETDEKYVRILHNEVPVPINHPSCSFKGDLCPLHEMTNIISDITNGAINQTCSHWQICNNNN
jgi:multiple inositol-polyphosphate phosphatase/2,3-bisphosphoglycerate 3-phosphatase